MNKISYIKLIMLTIILIMIDQILKSGLIQNGMQIIPGMIQISYVQNTGGAFGIGQGGTIQIIIINIIIIGIIIRFLIMQFNRMDMLTKIILSIVLAGGISNLLDRVLRGFVVDYIDVTEIISFPTFNLADVYVVIGWVALVLITIKRTFKEIKQTKSNI